MPYVAYAIYGICHILHIQHILYMRYAISCISYISSIWHMPYAAYPTYPLYRICHIPHILHILYIAYAISCISYICSMCHMPYEPSCIRHMPYGTVGHGAFGPPKSGLQKGTHFVTLSGPRFGHPLSPPPDPRRPPNPTTFPTNRPGAGPKGSHFEPRNGPYSGPKTGSVLVHFPWSNGPESLQFLSISSAF